MVRLGPVAGASITLQPYGKRGRLPPAHLEPAAFTIELLESGKDNSTPAQVERWLKPFRIERSFLLRHGIREFIAVNG